MARPAKSNEAQVSDYIQGLNHPLKPLVLAIRDTVLETDPSIGEQVKWNSLSYYYTGEMKAFDPKTFQRDLLVINVHKADKVLLVFPTGARIPNGEGLLEGNYTDGRRMITYHSLEELQATRSDLQSVIRQWLDRLEK
ncbi:DUF1801 domain-containing protein [Flavihumibacter rivuli]|uniref:DUF1801 domain-containing protein n=1 Tax=Flavihumibacter rivuli TaxID=2838156 RepID=UPI001BDE29FD|nr:DUF1801 domain-containing protein [Flavihumibacter rivuli]ULQ56002.1 DUF1801 domain-containing protein [Flavihumibacter rivuli]